MGRTRRIVVVAFGGKGMGESRAKSRGRRGRRSVVGRHLVASRCRHGGYSEEQRFGANQEGEFCVGSTSDTSRPARRKLSPTWRSS